MPQLTRVRSVLAVRDLALSKSFFVNQLGFVVDFDVDDWSFLSRDGFRVMLGHCPDATPARLLGDHSFFAYVGVEGIDDLYQEFRSRGVTPTSAPEDQPWGMREFGVTTPDGHRITFGQQCDVGAA